MPATATTLNLPSKRKPTSLFRLRHRHIVSCLGGCIEDGDLSSAQIIDDVKGGNMPPIPEPVGLRIKGVISKCWLQDPSKRPTMHDLLVEIQPHPPSRERPSSSFSTPKVAVRSGVNAVRAGQPNASIQGEQQGSSPSPAPSNDQTPNNSKTI